MRRHTLLFAAAALLALLLPGVAAGAMGGGEGEGNGIRGTITDGAGNPAEYIGVRGFKLVEGDWVESFFSWTGANGVFEMPFYGHSVTVKLYFFQKHVTEEEATWRPEWYDDAETIEAATPIVVPAGTWAQIGVVMAGPGSIVGRVTDAATGEPIEGIAVLAYLAVDGRARGLAPRCEEQGIKTGPEGYYEIGALRAGDWILEFRDPEKQWADQWSGGGMVERQARPVTVVTGATSTVDAALVPGGGLAVSPALADTGRALVSKGGETGFGAVCVDGFDPAGRLVAGRQDTWDWVFVLPAGDYFFRFSDCTDPVDYATTWYPSAASMTEAEPITVVEGEWNGTFFIYTAGRCAGRLPTIVGTPGNDVLVGTARRDVIAAGMGDDRVNGLGGDDIICLGPGNDFAAGGTGADLISGGDGADTLEGGLGHDRLRGGPGNDLLRGGSGPDLLVGGAGTDRLNGGLGDNTCLLGETW
jgi:Ca2+-binding RTX toxin-like protein